MNANTFVKIRVIRGKKARQRSHIPKVQVVIRGVLAVCVVCAVCVVFGVCVVLIVSALR